MVTREAELKTLPEPCPLRIGTAGSVHVLARSILTYHCDENLHLWPFRVL